MPWFIPLIVSGVSWLSKQAANGEVDSPVLDEVNRSAAIKESVLSLQQVKSQQNLNKILTEKQSVSGVSPALLIAIAAITLLFVFRKN